MKTQTIPISIPELDVIILDEIAQKEMSSRNRILRIAIKRYIEENGNH